MPDRILIDLLTAWFWFCGIRNLIKLRYAVIMRKAAKQKQLTELSAEITRQCGTVRGGPGRYRHIWAEYSLKDTQYTGKLICVPRMPVKTGSKYTVYICRKVPLWFVTDIRETFDAVLTYAVTAPLFLLCAAAMTYFLTLESLQNLGVIR